MSSKEELLNRIKQASQPDTEHEKIAAYEFHDGFLEGFSQGFMEGWSDRHCDTDIDEDSTPEDALSGFISNSGGGDE